MTPADDQAVDKREQRKIQRQRTLSLAKAVEISLKSIKVRFWRSLITMSGIILAIAFLMSIWTNTAVIEALRNVQEENEDKPAIDLLLQKKGVDTVQDQLKTLVITEDPTVANAAVAQRDKSAFALLLKDYAKHLRIIPILPTSPKLAERIAESDCVIIDHSLSKLTSPLAIQKLANFVSEGSSLLVIGSPKLGAIAGAAAQRDPKTVLEGMLALAGTGGTAQTGQIVPKRHSITRDVQWKNFPKLTYYVATPSKGAKVLATVDGKDPILAVKRVGKGSCMTYVAEDVGMLKHAQWSSGSTLVGQSLLWLTRGQRAGVGAKNTWLIVLSLLVCVVGIVNSMLMSVSERVREIGTMKCLGALDRFIVKLFLLESSFQGVIGTLVGLVVGFVLAFIRSVFSYLYIDPTTENWHFFAWDYFPVMDVIQAAFWAFLIGSILSVAAAIYPAYGAAKMQPVDAMRVEE